MPSDNEALSAGKGRLRALLRNWGRNTQTIEDTNNKIGGLGKTESLKPSMFRRFTQWLDQIVRLRRKEQKIINEIEAIEEKHRLLREAKRLRKAESVKAVEAKIEPQPEEPKPRRSFWLWLLLFAMMQSSQKKQDKPQNG